MQLMPLLVDQAETLLCPTCGEANLHHGLVRVWSREEDEPVLLTRIAADGTLFMERLEPGHRAGNPSARRGAVSIAFNCEMCGEVGDLCIVQHKGQTSVGWRSVTV